MQKYVGKVKFLIVLAIIGAFVWFLVISPMLTFRGNEKKLEDAAKRYYELNQNELPTGQRVKTLSLKKLFDGAYIKEDMYVPYTKKTCSVENSWVKVKRNNNNEFDYFVYLDCGILQSNIDHEGPEVKLNGDDEVTIGVGEVYKDEGVKSVVDNKDGKLNVDDVNIVSKVDTSKIGSYEVSYTIQDSLANKTEKIRTVNVVKTIKAVVKKDLESATNYSIYPKNNYVRLSNIMFRIYGIEGNNVLLVTQYDLANVNHNKIDDWLEYFDSKLADEAKELLVKKKFCNERLDSTALDTTECNSYTKERYSYIPSIDLINKATAVDDSSASFMRTETISWVANTASDKEAYAVRTFFYGSDVGKKYISTSVNDNYGVRPMVLVKGDTNIVSGKGTKDDPYTFGEIPKAKNTSKLNERYVGEYIIHGNQLWRIMNIESDGTTKVILENTLNDENYTPFMIGYDYEKNIFTYNPKDKKSVAYKINNQASKYIDTSIFVTHEIEVPIYKNNIIYKGEEKTEKYKVKLSAPNMYELFSAHPGEGYSYWLINTSKTENKVAAVSDLGVCINEDMPKGKMLSVRVVGFVNKNMVISSGRGTPDSPYMLK